MKTKERPKKMDKVSRHFSSLRWEKAGYEGD